MKIYCGTSFINSTLSLSFNFSITFYQNTDYSPFLYQFIYYVQRGGDYSYCTKNYLSPATMRMIDGMRTQLLGELVGRGFVRVLEEASTEGHRADLVRAVLVRIYLTIYLT